MIQESERKEFHIYSASGTGNSYRVAQSVGVWAFEQKYSIRHFPVEFSGRTIQSPKEKDINVAIVFPTHAFTMYWPMLRAVIRLKGKGNEALIFATRAGTKIGKYHLPGIGGSAIFLAAILLFLRGFRPVFGHAVDMPSNWLVVHPGFNEKTVDSITNKAESKLRELLDNWKSKGSLWLSLSNLWDFLWGVLLLPVSFGYLLMGRFLLAKLFFADESCDKCGVCKIHCPNKAISVTDKGPFWSVKCESCMRCMSVCPKKSVQVSLCWVVVLAWLCHLPVGLYLINLIPMEGFFPYLKYVEPVVNLLYFYVSLVIIYRIYFWFGKFSWFKKVLYATSVTRFYRRYSAPGQNLTNISLMDSRA
jgi:ferredoxin